MVMRYAFYALGFGFESQLADFVFFFFSFDFPFVFFCLLFFRFIFSVYELVLALRWR